MLERMVSPSPSRRCVSDEAEDSLSDDELNNTVVPAAAVADKLSSNSAETTKPADTGSPLTRGIGTSAVADRPNLQRQIATVEETTTKTLDDKVPSTSSTTADRLAKDKGGYRRSLHYLKKCIGREPSTISVRDCKLIKINLKAVSKYEKKYPHLPKRNPEIDRLSLIQMVDRILLSSEPSSTPTTCKGQTTRDGDLTQLPEKPSSSGKRPQNSEEGRTGMPVPATVPTLGCVAPSNPSSAKNPVKRVRSTEEPHPKAKRPIPRQDSKPSTSSARCKTNESEKSTATKAASQADLSHKVTPRSPPKSSGRGKKKTDRPLVPDELRIAVIDKSDPEGKISDKHWQLIENQLREIVFAGEGEPPKHTHFGSAAPFRGIKIICCENKESLNFLVSTIDGLGELWEGCQLAAVGVNEIPSRRVLSAWVPPPAVDPTRILTILGRQNPNLQTSSWKLVSHSPEGEGMAIRVSIDIQGQEYLRAREGKLHFGLGWIRFRLGQRQ
ncbi:uncharacterized protein [Musca autumnalis]|uniref:uncharacterized protein n=1 Tax=Musca autumnalis TaxID=221902 RepID=UPI003CEDA156